jgi:glutathione S-transferase
MNDTYALYYWNALPGRGEFVRLLFVDAGVDWIEVARDPNGEGSAAVVAARRGLLGGLPPYAPPILQVGSLVISQTANICAFVAARHGLVDEDPGRRAEALGLQMTIADVVSEVHDTHHPIAAGMYYEDQKTEAIAASRAFLDERLPAWLRYFSRVRAAGGGDWLLGDRLTYVDLSLYQLLRGLRYAFPHGFARAIADHGGLLAIHDAVAARPRIAAYAASPRCMPFNESGIFRRYPELDIPGAAGS